MNLLQLLKEKLGKASRISFCAGLFVLSTLGFQSASLHATSSTSHHCSDLELGIHLETCYWKAVQEQNIDKISEKVAHIFQGLNLSGVYTREEQIAGLTGITLPFFSIKNPVATRHDDVLVFSYNFIAPDESGLTNGPTISVWKKCDCSWKLVSHSYVPFIRY